MEVDMLRSTFRSQVCLAFVSLVLLLGGSLPSFAQGATLTATLTTNKGCGASAVFDLGELSTFQYSVSQTAFVTLQLRFPDGTSRVLVNQTISGGATRTLLGQIGNPTGERRLILDAVAGNQTAHVECTYTARGVTPPPGTLSATLETNRGCGAAAVFAQGELSSFRYSVSQTAFVTLRLQYPDGTSRVLVNQTVPGGVQQTITGRIGLPGGERRLILDAVAGSATAHVECTYSAQGGTPPPGPLTATLTTNRGCGAGAVFAPGETSVIQYSVSQTALVTLRLQFPDGTSRILVNQTVPGGVVQTNTGQISSLTGERRLILDAVAGTATAHVECTYTAQGVTPPPGPLTLNLTIDRGCGGQYRAGELITVTYSASASVNLTMLVQRADGSQSIIFTNRTVLAGQTQTLTGVIGAGVGRRTIILRPTALLPAVQASCDFNIVQ
jgi:hypothetical protein